MKKILLICMACNYFCSHAQLLNESLATSLARMPLHCIRQEFPNKTSHTADSSTDAILLPSQLHPSFYGCLDWHSSVHGHWLLVRVLKLFPGLAIKDSIIDVLDNSFQPGKIEEEVAYFTRYKTTKTFERTYGWAWWLKLDQELHSWNHPLAKKWHAAIQPLTKHIVQLWKQYLPKQTYPNRTGVHPNTAFALAFALDWSRELKDSSFEQAVINKATYFYLNNTATPAYLEPDGTDFFSPSLQIADLMRRVLPKQSFINWLNNAAPMPWNWPTMTKPG